VVNLFEQCAPQPASITGANESSDCSLPYRRNAPSTSKRAAQSAARTAPNARARVHAFIQQQGPRGAIADEIAAALGMPNQTASPRLTELRAAGMAVDAGIERPTRWGCMARVYCLPEFAPAAEGVRS
jgi:hypothetical protein